MEKDNKFILFKNDKGDNENRPDWRGELSIGGQTFEIAAWERTTEKCSLYLSGSIGKQRKN